MYRCRSSADRQQGNQAFLSVQHMHQVVEKLKTAVTNPIKVVLLLRGKLFKAYNALIDVRSRPTPVPSDLQELNDIRRRCREAQGVEPQGGRWQRLSLARLALREHLTALGG
jgi:hypothetical protein